MYQKEFFVQKTMKDLDKLRGDVFERKKITDIPIASNVPEEFTREKYIAVYRKIWATIRHDIWKKYKVYQKKDRVDVLSEERFNQIYEKCHSNFETVRQEVYTKIMQDDDTDKE
jgi:hypothetical protein